MTERFVLMALPRSGTNYFMSKIAPLDGVLAAWEPFNTRMDRWLDQTRTFTNLASASKSMLTDKTLRDTDPRAFFEQAFSPASSIDLSGVDAIGFKLFPQHSYELFSEISRMASMKVVVIERTNRLDSFVSYISASRTDRWIGNNDDLTGSIEFDAEFFEMFNALSEVTYTTLKHNLEMNNVPYLHLKYDQIIESEKNFQDFCSFLDVKYQKIESQLVKQITVQAVEFFSDRARVEDYFAKKHPHFLRSGR